MTDKLFCIFSKYWHRPFLKNSFNSKILTLILMMIQLCIELHVHEHVLAKLLASSCLVYSLFRSNTTSRNCEAKSAHWLFWRSKGITDKCKYAENFTIFPKISIIFSKNFHHFVNLMFNLGKWPEFTRIFSPENDQDSDFLSPI